MMGISIEDARRLTWWEYQALLWNWSDRHTPENAEEDVDAPPADFVARRHARLAERGIARMPE